MVLEQMGARMARKCLHVFLISGHFSAMCNFMRGFVMSYPWPLGHW